MSLPGPAPPMTHCVPACARFAAAFAPIYVFHGHIRYSRHDVRVTARYGWGSRSGVNRVNRSRWCPRLDPHRPRCTVFLRVPTSLPLLHQCVCYVFHGHIFKARCPCYSTLVTVGVAAQESTW